MAEAAAAAPGAAARPSAGAMIQRSHDKNSTGREARGQSEVGGRWAGDVTLRCRNNFYYCCLIHRCESVRCTAL